MGDSGGPLVTVDGALIGIVSWGVRSMIFGDSQKQKFHQKNSLFSRSFAWHLQVPCGKGLPDVFTRVSPFKNWIDETIDFPEVEEDYDGDYEYTFVDSDQDASDIEFMTI